MIDPTLVSLVSAATALVASITGPAVTLYIGRAQIKATVLSVNRQKWIDGFREAVAAFCSQVAGAAQMRDRIITEGRLNLAADPAMMREFEQLVFTFTKIRLMIDPSLDHHMTLLTAMKTMLDDIRTMPASTDTREHLQASVGRIVTMSQTMVRKKMAPRQAWRLARQRAFMHDLSRAPKGFTIRQSGMQRSSPPSA